MSFEYNERAAERRLMYEFLSGLCLKPPPAAMIEMIQDGSILVAMQAGHEGKAYEEMEAFVRESSGATDLEAELAVEHTALFALPSGVLPHEAVFLDQYQRLGGNVTIGVQETYRRAGAEIQKECLEMPDHIGMELGFMKFLCAIESECWLDGGAGDSLTKCVELQEEFLREHLLKWAFQCSDKILDETNNRFYRAIAHLIAEHLRQEKEYVASLCAAERSNKEEVCETTI